MKCHHSEGRISACMNMLAIECRNNLVDKQLILSGEKTIIDQGCGVLVPIGYPLTQDE